MTYCSRDVVHAAKKVLAEEGFSRMVTVAKECGVSVGHLGRVVRVHMGASFRAWRQQLVLEKATRLLRDQDVRSIKEVSALLGFSTPQSFSRWFRRAVGMPPTQHREH